MVYNKIYFKFFKESRNVIINLRINKIIKVRLFKQFKFKFSEKNS